MTDWGRWEESERRRWEARYGPPSRYLPMKMEDGKYTTGVGNRGGPWPRGRGHDYCWDPYNCISCGCGPDGPGKCHQHIAYVNGWRP